MLQFLQVVSFSQQHFEEARCEMQLPAMPSFQVHPPAVADSSATRTHLCDANDQETELGLQANGPSNDDQQVEVGSCLTDHDRALWDAAYAEEYNGLQNLGTWKVISEEEYQRLRPVVGRALPSMAISTIKYDGGHI